MLICTGSWYVKTATSPDPTWHEWTQAVGSPVRASKQFSGSPKFHCWSFLVLTKAELKLSLCLIKYHTMQTHGKLVA